MPPKVLAGYWFDETRNRYFPGNPPPVARPSKRSLEGSDSEDGAGPSSRSTTDQKARGASKVANMPSHGLLRRIVENGVNRRSVGQNFQEIRRRALYASTACTATEDVVHVHPLQYLTSLWVDPNNSDVQLCGDSEGYVYKRMQDEELGLRWEHQNIEDLRWRRELGMGSPVNSIESKNGVYLATSFGPTPRIVVSSLRYTETNTRYFSTAVFSGRNIQDPRDCCLSEDGRSGFVACKDGKLNHFAIKDDGSADCLGIVMLSDSSSCSDFMSIGMRQQEVLIGTRDGCVYQWDSRVQRLDPQLLLRVQGEQQRSPVLHVSAVREWELLVSQLNGELQTFDMRFLSPRTSSHRQTSNSSSDKSASSTAPDPIVKFHGHSNDHNFHLGITHDPSGNILFAAGDDHLVRGWDMRSGQALEPPPPPPDADPGVSLGGGSMRNSLFRTGEKLLSTRFVQPVRALCMTTTASAQSMPRPVIRDDGGEEGPPAHARAGQSVYMVSQQKVMRFDCPA